MPQALEIVQTEWDALLLDNYNLRRALADCRKELAYALYQHDAACRVISRLVKEKDKLVISERKAREELGES